MKRHNFRQNFKINFQPDNNSPIWGQNVVLLLKTTNFPALTEQEC